MITLRDDSRAPVLVKACLNGPRTRLEHPAVPVSPAEIAADVREVVSARAGAVHFHPRGTDGEETLEADSCAEVMRLVRSVCPDVPLGLSTAEWIEKNPARRLALIAKWTVLPDFASVNFNEAGAIEVCKLLVQRGVGVEVGLWSIADAKKFVLSGIGEYCLRVLVEITNKDSTKAVEEAIEIEGLLTRAKVRSPRLHHGHGKAAWSVMENALRQGHDVRVGLEDTTFLPDGTVAKNNRELVERAVRLAHNYGRAPS